MNIFKPALLVLISTLTYSSLYSMVPSQRPSTGKGLEVCISGLLHNPGEDTPQAMWNILQANGLDVALMEDYARISACTHYIKRAFRHQNIAQIIQQPTLTQCITDALRYTYEFLDDDTIRYHAQNITRQLRCAHCKRPTPLKTPDTSTATEEPKAKKQHDQAKEDACTGRLRQKRTERSENQDTRSESEDPTTKKPKTEGSVVPFFQHPYLIQYMAELLPLKDRFQLACASKAICSSLHQPNRSEHLRTFMREVANPIDFIIHKAQGNPNVYIDGIIYNTQEALDFFLKNIAEILINNIYDPILYVLEQAQGRDTVEIYEKSFSTNELIQELYRLGADVNRVYDRTLHHCLNLMDYSPGQDIALAHLEKITITHDIYDSLTEEQQLDLAQWHVIQYNSPLIPGNLWEEPEEHIQEINELYHDLIEQCQSIAQMYPKDGIVIYMPLSGEDIIITKELINSLSRFNIVSLIIENSVDFCDGINYLSQLKHLRELYIFEIYDDKFNVSLQELCNLAELRSLVIHSEHDNNLKITIPSQIKNLKKLHFLDLRELDFNQFPAEIGELKQLQLLAFDCVRTLTPELASLKNLKIYQGTWEQTDTNKILAQQCLSRLKNLQKIYILDDYQLEDLGEEIKHLLSLKSIHIDHTVHDGFKGIRYIPDNLELLPSLKKLIIAADSRDYTISFAFLKHIVNKRIKIFFYEFNNLETLRNIIALREYIMARKSLSENILQANGDPSIRTEPTQMAALLLQQSVHFTQLKRLVAKYSDIKSYVDFLENAFLV